MSEALGETAEPPESSASRSQSEGDSFSFDFVQSWLTGFIMSLNPLDARYVNVMVAQPWF